MPIDYRIDHEHRLVIAEGRAIVTVDDVMSYQRDVWSRPEVKGYDELIDMSLSEGISEGPQTRMHELAERSTASDPEQGWSRLAIVARSNVTFGVARQYQAYRQLNERSRKEVAVFRAREEALEWLNDRRWRNPVEPVQSNDLS